MLLLLFLITTHATIANTQRNTTEKYKNLESITHCSPEETLIDYSHNFISTVANDTFLECLALKTVKMGHNKINKIEAGAFWHLEDFEYINLSHNRINNLDHNIFANNQKLRTVILSHNPLVVPQLTSDSLKNLVCNFCKRTEVEEDTFAAIPNIQTISLVGTELLPFDVKGLATLHSLQEFIINDKNSKRCFRKNEYPTLVHLQQNNVNLGPDVFCRINGCLQTKNLVMCKHMNLKTINPPKYDVIMADYSYNSISRVKNESFVSQHSMRILKLAHNLIEHIENGAFRTLGSLQYIDLSHNKLQTIQDSIFEDNKKLLTIELSHNSIIVPHFQSYSLETLVCDFCKQIIVEEKTFMKMPNLTSLRLLGTEVMPFDESAAKTLRVLREFEVTGNDSRRCFSEEDYPGLLYLQKQGVVLGDDVFCEQETEMSAYSTFISPDDVKRKTIIYLQTNNHAQRNAVQTIFGLSLTYIVILHSWNTYVTFP